MHLSPSKCKVLSQIWWGDILALTLCKEHSEIVFLLIGMSETRSRYASLKLVWPLPISYTSGAGVTLGFHWKVVYSAPIRSVYGCETWPAQEDLCRLTVFNHWCLSSLARVRWQQHAVLTKYRQEYLDLTAHQWKELFLYVHCND